MIALDTHEIAWAAGFFDGEGCTYTTPSYNYSPCLTVAQNDRSLLERFQRAMLGLGRITAPQPQSGKNRPMYYWRVQNWRDAQAVLALLWRFLSAPKQAQAAAKFAQFRSRTLKRPEFGPDGRQSECKRGHSLADAYIDPDGGRECRTCRKDRRAPKQYAPALET